MKASSCIPGIGLVLAAPLLAKTAQQPATLVVGPDLIADSLVDGEPAKVQINLMAERTLILNADAARRMGFKPGFLKVKGVIGRQKFTGFSAVKTYTMAGVPIKRRIIWFDNGISTPGADGIVGPLAVAQDSVTINLRPRREGERGFIMPLSAVKGTYGRLATLTRIGDQNVWLTWDLSRDNTLVTAAAAAGLASSHGGHFVGTKRQERVLFSVERPVRQMALATPLSLGPIHFDEVSAWVGDYGDTSQVPDDSADPNEIVVTAKGSKIQPVHAIIIGRKDMAHCSSITFDKVQMQVRMSCL